MSASKETPATQILEWAVGKLDEATKIDWVEKLSALTASKPAYLRNGLMPQAAPSRPAPEPASAPTGGGGPSRAELDGAMARATQAEARADSLARRVRELEQQLRATNSHTEVSVADEDEDDHQKSHWWSRHH
jgi:hypothetical protein